MCRLDGFLCEREIGRIAIKAGGPKVQYVFDESQSFIGSHWTQNKDLRPPDAVPQFAAKP